MRNLGEPRDEPGGEFEETSLEKIARSLKIREIFPRFANAFVSNHRDVRFVKRA